MGLKRPLEATLKGKSDVAGLWNEWAIKKGDYSWKPHYPRKSIGRKTERRKNMWEENLRQTFSSIQEAKTLEEAKQAAKGCIGEWEDDFPTQEEVLEWAIHCVPEHAAKLKQRIAVEEDDCSEEFVARIAEAIFDDKGKEELHDDPMDEGEEDAPADEDLIKEDGDIVHKLAQVIHEQSKVSAAKARPAIEDYIEKETVSQADVLAAAAVALSFDEANKKMATTEDTMAVVKLVRKMKGEKPKKRTREDNTAEVDDSAQSEPKQRDKVPDALVGKGIQKFLNRLHDSREEEPKVAQMILIPATTAQLCAQIQVQMDNQTAHRYTAAYRRNVLEGCLINVLKFDQVPSTDIAKELGVNSKKPEKDKGFIFARKLHELIFKLGAHRFLQVRPANKTVLATFKKHIRAIVSYVQQNPNELARWTKEPSPVTPLRVTNRSGNQVQSVDVSTLF